MPAIMRASACIDDAGNASSALTTWMRCSHWRQQCAARIDDSSELIVYVLQYDEMHIALNEKKAARERRTVSAYCVTQDMRAWSANTTKFKQMTIGYV